MKKYKNFLQMLKEDATEESDIITLDEYDDRVKKIKAETAPEELPLTFTQLVTSHKSKEKVMMLQQKEAQKLAANGDEGAFAQNKKIAKEIADLKKVIAQLSVEETAAKTAETEAAKAAETSGETEEVKNPDSTTAVGAEKDELEKESLADVERKKRENQQSVNMEQKSFRDFLGEDQETKQDVDLKSSANGKLVIQTPHGDNTFERTTIALHKSKHGMVVSARQVIDFIQKNIDKFKTKADLPARVNPEIKGKGVFKNQIVVDDHKIELITTEKTIDLKGEKVNYIQVFAV